VRVTLGYRALGIPQGNVVASEKIKARGQTLMHTDLPSFCRHRRGQRFALQRDRRLNLRESVLICGPLFFSQTLFESWTPNFGAVSAACRTSKGTRPSYPKPKFCDRIPSCSVHKDHCEPGPHVRFHLAPELGRILGVAEKRVVVHKINHPGVRWQQAVNKGGLAGLTRTQ